MCRKAKEPEYILKLKYDHLLQKLVAGTGFITGRSPGPEEEAEGDQAAVIARLSDVELDKEFERMLDNMNLTDQKKEPLRRLPLIKKREMLTMNCKTNHRASSAAVSLVLKDITIILKFLFTESSAREAGESRRLHPAPGQQQWRRDHAEEVGRGGVAAGGADQQQPGLGAAVLRGPGAAAVARGHQGVSHQVPGLGLHSAEDSN